MITRLENLFSSPSFPNSSVILSWSCYNHDTSRSSAYYQYNVGGFTTSDAVSMMMSRSPKAKYIQKCGGLFCGEFSSCSYFPTAAPIHHPDKLKLQEIRDAKIAVACVLITMAALYLGVTVGYLYRSRAGTGAGTSVKGRAKSTPSSQKVSPSSKGSGDNNDDEDERERETEMIHRVHSINNTPFSPSTSTKNPMRN